MNIDHFIQSELKVTASEHLNISEDLKAEQNHSISELLDNEETPKKENKLQKED